jgi:DNA-binding NarL/FixJ family response regulator
VETIKVVLVDDHHIVLDGMESILNGLPGIQVVGKASSAAAAEELVRRQAPALVLTDISMGEVSGLELTRTLTERYPLVRVLVLSMHDDVQLMAALLEAGAAGYLLKNVTQTELLAAISAVMAGRQYIQQSVAGAYGRARQRQEEAGRNSTLTPRELEILQLIVHEQTTAEISRRLFLSERTVETHRKNIGRKTGAKTVIALVNWARTHGLLP